MLSHYRIEELTIKNKFHIIISVTLVNTHMLMLFNKFINNFHFLNLIQHHFCKILLPFITIINERLQNVYPTLS